MKKLFTLITAVLVSLATMATTYTGKLTVTVNGEATTQDGVTINIDQSNGAYDLSLKNLLLDGMPVGSINLDGLTATTNDKVAMLYAYENVNIAEGDLAEYEGQWMGPIIGPVPIRMSARIYDNSFLAVNIDIDMMSSIEQIIEVGFESDNNPFHIPNGDFEDWTASSGEPDHWHGFKSAKGNYASMAKGTLGSDTGRSGEGKCAVATSGSIIGIVNNGTFTNGQLNAGSMSAANTANHSEMDKSSTAKDKNGDPFYTAIGSKPDAIQLWYKFTQGTAQTTYKYASVSAITFDGSYYQDPEDKTYTNVAAKAQKTDITTTTTWTELNIPFVYEKNPAASEAVLVTISTNATPGKGSNGDKIYVDDLKLVYNLPSVTDIQKDGTTIAGFDAETKDYVFEIGMDEVLTASQFAATIEGAVAGILDIRVNEIPGGLGYEVAVCAISGDLALNKYTLTYLRPVPYATVYVDKASVEGDVYYFDSEPYSEWPGVAISSLTTAEKDGVEYYVVKFYHEGENLAPNVIFSQLVDGNRVQTVGIPVADGDVLKYLGGKRYELNGTAYPLPAYYLVGELNNWNQSAEDEVIEFAKNDDVFTLTRTFSGAFKIKDQDGNWYGGEADGDSHWLTIDYPSVTLVDGKNLYLDEEAEYTLTIENGVLTVTGFVPEELSYRIIGGINDGAWDQVYELTLNSKTGYYESAADLNIAKGFNCKFNLSGNKGTDKWYGGNTEDDHWFDIQPSQFGNAISISEAGQNIYFAHNATGVKFAVKADFSELIIDGAYYSVDMETVAEAGEYVVTEAHVVAFDDEAQMVYTTDGQENWLPIYVDNAELYAQAKAAATLSYIEGNFDANETAPTFTATAFTAAGEFVENSQEIYTFNLADESQELNPKAGQVIKIQGIWHNGELRGYSGANGGNRGRSFTVLGATDALVEGTAYTIPVAVSLKEAWDAAGAPKRVAKDGDATFQNLQGKIVGGADMIEGVSTAVTDLNSDAAVVSTRYFNVEGRELAEPAQGVTIVVNTLSDGTVKATKVLK